MSDSESFIDELEKTQSRVANKQLTKARRRVKTLNVSKFWFSIYTQFHGF